MIDQAGVYAGSADGFVDRAKVKLDAPPISETHHNLAEFIWNSTSFMTVNTVTPRANKKDHGQARWRCIILKLKAN